MRKIISFIYAFTLLIGCVGCSVTNNFSEEQLTEYEAGEQVAIPIPEPEPVFYEKFPSVPQLFQSDFPYSPYGKYGTVSTHGCGIVCISMVASYLLDTSISPQILAEMFGEYNTEVGSSWSIFEKTAPMIGITMEKQVNSLDEAIEALAEGKVVIACARSNSIFTDGGHFVTFTGLTEDGKVTVNDPYRGNYMKSSHKILLNGFEKGFTKDELTGCGPFWIYSAKDESVITNTTEIKRIGYEVIEKEGLLPYYIYTPSVIDVNKKTPVIIWLHDFGGSVLSKIGFTNSELPKELQRWILEEPNAYIVCPQMDSRDWCANSRIKQIQAIIDDLTTNYNIDMDKIVIMGQGTGGEGAIYFANQLPEAFSAAIAFGPYNRSYVNITNTSVPVKIFIGETDKGAAPETNTFINTRIIPNYGEEVVNIVDGVAHAEIVGKVFGTDKNWDRKSDILQWAIE